MSEKDLNTVLFKSFHSRKLGIFDVVHSDVCGLIKINKLSRSLFFMTFINDHSKKS